MLDQQIGGKMIFLRLKVLKSIRSLPTTAWVRLSPIQLSILNTSSCIDLIFTNQPNLVTGSGVHPSLHPKCHHQIVFVKLSLKVEYSLLYVRLIWDHKNTDIPSINRAIDIFDWGNSFEVKNVHEQVHFFNKKNPENFSQLYS